VTRVPASEIEALVVQVLRSSNEEPERAATAGVPDGASATESNAALVERRLEGVVVRASVVEVTIKGEVGLRTVRVPWTPARSQRRREIVLLNESDTGVRPIRAEARATLLHAIAKGRAWLAEIVAGRVSGTEAIAAREGCSERSARMALSLASLAPDIVRAGVEGRLPRGIGLSRLTDLPLSWTEQRAALGFTSVDQL